MPDSERADALRTLAACHWSCQMLRLMRDGVIRPGEMRRRLPGLAQKVQTSCLQKMAGLGLLARTAFPEVPPHVEYSLTADGQEFVELLERLEERIGYRVITVL